MGVGRFGLRARYYDSRIGAFTSEDTHWNTGNMLYGDDPDNTVPDITSIMQSMNLYVYCMGNPVNLWDPSGMVAYEKFATATEAAIDWAWNYYGITDYTLFEVGSLIFSVTDQNGNTYYSYTDAAVGTPHEIDVTKVIDMVPNGAKVVGMIHSHPNGPDFSDNDIEDGKNRGYDYLYVVTPTGDRNIADVKATTVWDNYNTPSYSVGTVRYNKLSVHRQVNLHNKFYKQWHNHYHDSYNQQRWCNMYHCRSREWPREYK